MSASFQEHLELALGDEYRVVRELGGGGMSRVFLAQEVALGRQVVIKVLTPELAAGVNRERFRREVQLAAGLQHPMIVPLLTAGEAEGLLWYTMPFVEGESLRERLNRGPMSGREALPILVDIARALGAAHRKNIVHRDIKPGNILLHEQHAVVADFGVAKALTAAVAGSTGLTTSGLAVGTPAYMSPEQAAGDATVDARSDIYALGCVAYEMLAGKTPFVDPSAARLLVAQVSQQPVPLQQVAPVKPGMAAVIMRCLEKDPTLRWPTADALAEAFELQRYTGEPTPLPPMPVAPSTPVPPSRVTAAGAAVTPAGGVSRTRMISGGVAVAIAVALGVALSGNGGSGPKPAVAFSAPQTVLLADVENQTPDSTLGNLLSESLRSELQESKIVTVMTPAATASALERMQRPATSSISRKLAGEIAVREGVAMVVAGRIQKVGNTYLVRAALVSPGDGGEASAVQETAATEDDLIAAIGRLARRTREKLGESSSTLTALPPMERVTTTSLDALRKYTEAIRIGDMPGGENPRREIHLLEEAVALDSTFAMAWRRLGVKLASGPTYSNERLLRAKAALTRAYQLRERLSPVERGLAEAAYFSTVEVSPGRAAAAYQNILTEQPTNTIALNNLASNALEQGLFERLREYGARYVAVDSSTFEAWPWVIWGAYGTGRVDEARDVRAAMRKRFTSDADVRQLDELDLQWLTVERDYAAVERLARARIRTTREPHQLERYERALIGALTARGMLGAAWVVNDSMDARWLSSPDTANLREARGDALRQRYFDKAWFGDDTTGIAKAIQAFIATSGVDRWRMHERPMFNLVIDHILAGDAAAARARFAAYRAEAVRQKGLGAMPPVSSPVFASLEGQVLLAERRPQEALRVLLPLGPEAMRFPQPELFHIGRAYLDAGQRDSARVWLARIADSPDPRRAWTETAYRSRSLRLLCDLADTREQRVRWCGALAAEWKDADAVLQPIVARARARLAE